MKKSVVLFLSILFFLVGITPLSLAQDETLERLLAGTPDAAYMIIGELVPIEVDALTRLSVVNPDVADIVETDENQITVIGKGEGQTPLFIWDDQGKRMVMLYVAGDILDLVQSRIKRLFKKADITEIDVSVNEEEGKVLLSGKIPAWKKDVFENIIGGFGNQLINFVKDEEPEEMVRIDAQITELEESVDKILGVDWNGESITYTEDLPSFDGSVGDFFKIGTFSRSAPVLQAQLNLLVSEGKGRILSKPNLVVLSGSEASFLVGGEIPIRTTTTTTTGSTQENIEFKEYGISLTITPTIWDQKIDLLMNVEVSEIDNSTITNTGDTAFLTRSATTRLFLDDAQTVILAGLIKHTESETTNRVPFVSKVPVLGLLFRSVNSPKKDTETVISLTPTILKSKRKKKETVKKNVSFPAPSYKGAAPSAPKAPQGMNEYISSLQRKIAREVIYPSAAERLGWEGTVNVRMLVLKDGTLAFAFVKNSSGQEAIDENALSTVKKAAPFSAFPSGVDLQEISLVMPIVYRLQ